MARAERLPEDLSLQVLSTGLHFLTNSQGKRFHGSIPVETGVCLDLAIPPALFFAQRAAPFGSSRVKFPCLFLSFNYFTFSLERLK